MWRTWSVHQQQFKKISKTYFCGDAGCCYSVLYFPDKGQIRKTANAFGIAKNTMSMIIRKVTKAILNHIAKNYIKLPRTEEELHKSYVLCFLKNMVSHSVLGL